MAEPAVEQKPQAKVPETKGTPPERKGRLGPGVQKLLDLIHLKKKQHPDDPDVALEAVASGEAASERPTHTKQLLRRQHERPTAETRRTFELSPKELRALSFDFQTYLTKNPPIEGVFDPDRADKSAPEAIRQQEAIASCRTLIEHYIEQETKGQSPQDLRKLTDSAPVSILKLKNLVATFGANYGFTELQTKMSNELIDAYYAHRQEGIDLRMQYPDNRELARKITGMEFSSKVSFDVKVGAWGLEITTDNKSVQRLLYNDQEPKTDFCAGGLAFVGKIPPFIILNKGYSDEATLGHESQHIRYAIQKRVLRNNNQDVLQKYDDYPPTEQERLENRMRRDRAFHLDQAKDEIFAYTFNSDHFPTELFFGKDGNPYDYAQFQREYGETHHDPNYQAASQKVFVTEYQSLIASSAEYLRALQKAGYQQREAIALLADKPLEAWADTAQQLLAAKGITLTLPAVQAARQPTRRVRHPETNEEVPLFDVVITGDEQKPNWYKERLHIEAQKKTREIPTDTQSGPEDEINNNLSLTNLNRSLYDRSREEAGTYIRELGIEQYFTLLDQQTVDLGKMIQNGQLTEDVLTGAVKNLLDAIKRRVGVLRSPATLN